MLWNMGDRARFGNWPFHNRLGPKHLLPLAAEFLHTETNGPVIVGGAGPVHGFSQVKCRITSDAISSWVSMSFR